MGDRHTDPPFAGRVSARRNVTLAALRDAGEPLSAEQVAATVGVHVNTARFHLKRLVEDGLADQATSDAGSRGRPQVLYRARSAAGDRSYLMLAQMLSEVAVASGEPGPAAEVGRAWGERLLGEFADPPSPDTAGVAARVEAVMDSIGFEPHVTVRGDEVDIELRHCPFLEVARRHPGLVCAMHQSLVQGVLDGLGSGLRVTELAPFVTPNTCRAHLRPAG